MNENSKERKTSKKREIFNTKLNQLLQTMNDGQMSLDPLENKRKIKSTAISVYDNRYQAQKEIIAAQKATIAEQKEVIEKLKLKNATFENEVASLRNLIEQLKQSSLQKVEEKGEQIFSINNKNINNSPKDSDILCRMKIREEERKKRWQHIKEQKENKELMKKVMLASKEEEDRLKVIEEKKKREQEETDKRNALEEKLKRIQARKQVALFKFKVWYTNYLAEIGFWKWNLYIKQVHAKREIVSFRIRRFLAMRYFQIWLSNANIVKEQRSIEARNHYLITLQRKVINKWKKFTFGRQQLRTIVEKHLTKIYLHKIIIQWNNITKEIKIIRHERLMMIKERWDRFLITFYFNYWRELPKIMREKREQECRIRSWLSRVKEILPDFVAEECST